MNYRWLAIFLLCFFPVFLTSAKEKPTLLLSTNAPNQGEVVRVTIKNAHIESATFKKKSVPLFSFGGDLVAFLPISGTETPGSYTFKTTFSDGTFATRTIKVKKKKFPQVSLGIPKGSNLTSATLVTKLQQEKLAIEDIVKKRTEAVYFESKFQYPLPVKSVIASPFGEIRKTGSNIIRHWGIDYKAPKGTDVLSISGGVVVKSYLDSTYGNTIIIDHGQGVFSLYMHLDERLKNEGDVVSKGETIGFVGNTGYSFGPHLHLSLKVNGVSTDPEQFIKLMQ